LLRANVRQQVRAALEAVEVARRCEIAKSRHLTVRTVERGGCVCRTSGSVFALAYVRRIPLG
jgi:hypothetical protein